MPSIPQFNYNSGPIYIGVMSLSVFAEASRDPAEPARNETVAFDRISSRARNAPTVGEFGGGTAGGYLNRVTDASFIRPGSPAILGMSRVMPVDRRLCVPAFRRVCLDHVAILLALSVIRQAVPRCFPCYETQVSLCERRDGAAQTAMRDQVCAPALCGSPAMIRGASCETM